MAKRPAVRPREVIRLLEKNGIVLDHSSASHLISYDSISRRRAVIPRHNRDTAKGTLLSLLRESRFTRDQMVSFLAN
jgi:predicted RNA binding protein YcfA (HicA-like mRNA interferase family)